eukprot:5873237-Pyramimonas_sp.AAC.1
MEDLRTLLNTFMERVEQRNNGSHGSHGGGGDRESGQSAAMVELLLRHHHPELDADMLDDLARFFAETLPLLDPTGAGDARLFASLLGALNGYILPPLPRVVLTL